MTDRKSGNKSFTQKDKAESSETQDDSITNVHFSEYFNKRWKDGKRLPIPIRQNNKLYEDFKPVAQRLYGSVCRAIETFEAAVIAASEQKVHFCNTDRAINIDKIVIERNLRPRRKLETQKPEKPKTSRVIEQPKCDFCGKPSVVGRFRHVKSGREDQACDYHAKDLRSRSDWEEIP